MSLFICCIVITNCRDNFWVGLSPKGIAFILNYMKVSPLTQRLKVGLVHIKTHHSELILVLDGG